MYEIIKAFITDDQNNTINQYYTINQEKLIEDTNVTTSNDFSSMYKYF